MSSFTSLTLVAAIAAGTIAQYARAAEATVEPVVVKAVAHFNFAGDAIIDSDRDALMSEVAKQKDVTWQTVTATGHTDSIGAARYNERLSQRRAASVKRYLVNKGLSPTMVAARGKGAADPVASNADESGRAQNRRTEVEFRGVRTAEK